MAYNVDRQQLSCTLIQMFQMIQIVYVNVTVSLLLLLSLLF